MHRPDVVHSSELMHRCPTWKEKRVLVVGGGQSGAEAVQHLLASDEKLPSRLTWCTGRIGLQPLDDSPFTNEWFTPEYIDHFMTLSSSRRRYLVGRQRLASDGISEALLWALYRRIYQLRISNGSPDFVEIRYSTRVVDMKPSHEGMHVTVRDEDRATVDAIGADIIILCTGYRAEMPEFLREIDGLIHRSDGVHRVNSDYSLSLDAPSDLQIFVQNLAEPTHGIADGNLSLSSWRSARILNAIARRDVYKIGSDRPPTCEPALDRVASGGN